MINNNFVFRVNSLKLVSFYETVNTRVKWVILFQLYLLILQWLPGGTMVVPEFSATLEYPGETRVGLNRNHLTIAKYSSRSEVTVTASLHTETTSETKAEPEPVFSIAL